MMDDDECAAFGGIIIGIGSRSIGENLSQYSFVQHKSLMI
jgi:hypothetical protein